MLGPCSLRAVNEVSTGKLLWLRCAAVLEPASLCAPRSRSSDLGRLEVFFGIPQHQFELLAPQLRVFLSLAHGFHNDVPIVRANQQDKEYHFQNWVKRRIQAAGLAFQEQGRHGYPDFILEDHPCGFEVKGLAHPGRVADFDCNSQLPLAQHDGRSIFYIFGRYPQTTEQEYAVFDLVLCSASFLNAETENTNTNQSFRGAGSYGDILIRDRRMYVCATPYALAAGTSAQAVHTTLGGRVRKDEPILPIRISRTASDGNPIRSFDSPFPAIDTATVWGFAQGNVKAERVAKDRTTEKYIRNPGADVTLWRISAKRMRTFTAREYARLQTFPDDWAFIGANKREVQLQIGNAVPVRFARAIANCVRNALEAQDHSKALKQPLGKKRPALA